MPVQPAVFAFCGADTKQGLDPNAREPYKAACHAVRLQVQDELGRDENGSSPRRPSSLSTGSRRNNATNQRSDPKGSGRFVFPAYFADGGTLSD